MWCTWEAPLAAVARCRFVQDVPMARMTSRRFAGSRHRCPNLQRCPTGTQAAVTPSHLAPNMPVRQTPEEALRLVAFASLLHPCLHLPRCPIGAQATARSSHRTAPRAIGQITAATRRSFPEGYTALWGHRGVFWRPTTALSLQVWAPTAVATPRSCSRCRHPSVRSSTALPRVAHPQASRGGHPELVPPPGSREYCRCSLEPLEHLGLQLVGRVGFVKRTRR